MGPIAQSEEQWTFNPCIDGSSPKIHSCLVAMSGQVLALLVILMPNL